jgi:hypothetical protein
MRKKKIGISFLIIIIIFISLLFPCLKSYSIMGIYNIYEKNNSLLKKENINISISGGLATKRKDWYPFVLTYNDNGDFSNYLGRKVKLTILYNFGAFDISKGSSLFYNKNSPFFCSFYGAYIIKEEDTNRMFGFKKDGTINLEDISLLAEYDYKYLVLNGLGCDVPYMEFTINRISTVDKFINYNKWFKIDANINTNSVIHKKTNNQVSYIQYGQPPREYAEDEDFPMCTLHGRLYAKYFSNIKTTILFYIICPEEKEINTCDKLFISKAAIKY